MNSLLRLTFKKVQLCLLVLHISSCSIAADLPLNAQAFTPSMESPIGMKRIKSEADDAIVHYSSSTVYAEHEGHPLKLRLFIPNSFRDPASGQIQFDKVEQRPLIVYIQGSAWMEQDLDVQVPMLIDFAKNTGYAIASVEYRPSSVSTSPAQLEDVKSAIRFMRANAKKYHINPERIGIWGDSSGGHLSSLVAVTADRTEFDTDSNPGYSSKVNTVVNFYGPTDFVEMAKYPSIFDHSAAGSPEYRVIGGAPSASENKAKVDQYNPIHYISAQKSVPPMLIMHADSDPIVPFNQSVLLYKALKEANQNVEFYNVSSGGHGVRFFTPNVLAIVKAHFEKYL